MRGSWRYNSMPENCWDVLFLTLVVLLHYKTVGFSQKERADLNIDSATSQ